MTIEAYSQRQLREWIADGLCFQANIGLFSSGAGTNNYALAVFNSDGFAPNPQVPGRDIFIWSARVSNGSGGQTAALVQQNSNPAFSQNATPSNMNSGGPASSLPASAVTWANTNQTLPGSFSQVATLASADLELLSNGAGILLPARQNNALILYIQTYAAGINSALLRWAEL